MQHSVKVPISCLTYSTPCRNDIPASRKFISNYECEKIEAFPCGSTIHLPGQIALEMTL